MISKLSLIRKEIDKLPLPHMMLIQANTLVSFLKRSTELFGAEADSLWYEAGITAGRVSTISNQKLFKKSGREYLTFLCEELAPAYGLFTVQKCDIDLKTGKGIIRISKSFSGSAYGKSTKPVCDYLCGALVGILTEVSGIALSGEEINCIAQGDPECVFKFNPID